MKETPANHRRSLMSTVTFVQNKTAYSALLADVHKITLDIFDQYSRIPDLEWKFVYTPIPRFYTDRSEERGGNMMGLNNTQENLISKCSSSLLRARCRRC